MGRRNCVRDFDHFYLGPSDCDSHVGIAAGHLLARNDAAFFTEFYVPRFGQHRYLAVGNSYGPLPNHPLQELPQCQAAAIGMTLCNPQFSGGQPYGHWNRRSTVFRWSASSFFVHAN